MQRVQHPNQSNVDNLKNVTHEAGRHFRNKEKDYLTQPKLMNLKTTVR